MNDKNALRARLQDYMRSRGLKSTRQRAAILDAFLNVQGHVALDELLSQVQRALPGVGFATVYRTMKLFSEAGVAHERRFGDGQTRYEPAEMGHDHHDHLICTNCGHIFEFEDDEIEERQRAMASSMGLNLVSHRLDMWGECREFPTCSRYLATNPGSRI